MEIHTLGLVDFDSCRRLQQFLVLRAQKTGFSSICLLFCEHPRLISVGRGGSPTEIRWDALPIRRRQVPVRWTRRGGGCMLHQPGQLAVYPIVPLLANGWSVGEYMEMLRISIAAALESVGVTTSGGEVGSGLWGRSGRIAEFGVSVRNNVAYQGAFINVSPSLGLFDLLASAGAEPVRVGSIQSERRSAAQMPKIRTALVQSFSKTFDREEYHLHTGHPWLTRRRTA